eukprot:4247422-Pleurochrysis_carterae.AAC.1
MLSRAGKVALSRASARFALASARQSLRSFRGRCAYERLSAPTGRRAPLRAKSIGGATGTGCVCAGKPGGERSAGNCGANWAEISGDARGTHDTLMRSGIRELASASVTQHQ